MILSNNLAEDSISYKNEADIYQIFSEAEDYPQKILEEIIPVIHNKNMVDLGCGNGKYSSLLSIYAKSIISIDKSFEQLTLANKNNNSFNTQFLQADATHIPLNHNEVDIVFSSWMLGTILDPERQLQALNEMKRICIKNGCIVLIENALDSEFELLRGRDSKKDNRTANYNNWLISQGFKIHSTINTYFKFENLQVAQYVFESIWKDRLTKKVTSNIVEHKVHIFICKL